MKAFFTECVLVLSLLLVSVALVPMVQAGSFTLPFNFQDENLQHLPQVGITEGEDNGTVAGTGVTAIREIFNNVGSFISLILGIIAVGAIFIAGYQLITAQSAISEEIEKQKMNVVYILLGLIVFALGGNFINNLLFVNEGQYIALEQGQSYQEGLAEALGIAKTTMFQIRGLLNLFLSFSGAGAILMLVIAGMRLVINPGSDEMIDKQKKVVGYTAVGIIIIGLSDTVINGIVFPLDPNTGQVLGVNVSLLEVQLQGLSNYILGFLGIIIFVTFVASGLMMVVYYGNDDMIGKVKSTLKNVVIGALIAYSAYTIVSTLLRTFLAAEEGAVISMLLLG